MAITDTSAAQLIINQLTREQYNKLTKIEDNQLYIIDENILSSANEYFKTPVEQKDFQISAYADAAVVNKAYVTKVVSNINDSLTALTAKHDSEISAKQDKLTDNNEGAYIDITASDNSSLTTIAVTNVVSAGAAIGAEATQSSLTTSKAVKEYVATQIGNVDQDFIKSVTGDYTDNTNAKVSVKATTTDKAVTLTIHTKDIASAQALEDHTSNGDIHVTAEQKANWTSTSATVADNKSTWDKADTALQEITSNNTEYIKIVENSKVDPVIVTATLENITTDTKGIVPPSVIAALNAKVNELQQIPQFSVVVAYSINLTAKTYKLAEGGVDNDCVQNTVYLVPDGDAAAGTHIEYLCYSETRVIEQIGTTEIDLSDYAKTEDINGGFDEHGVKVDLSNGKLTGGVTPGSITKDNNNVVTGGAVYSELVKKQDNLTDENEGDYIDITKATDTAPAKISVTNITTLSSEIDANDTGLTTGKAVHDYVAAKTASGSHTHAIADVTGLQNALNAKQDNLKAGSYINIANDNTISVSAVTTAGTDITLDDDGLTTGQAVREALNSMIVFRKHS